MVNMFSSSWLRPSHAFHAVWLILNGIIFWNTYRLYKGQPQYYYLHQILGSGLCISRGTGAVLNVSCGLILLPTCKRAATTLRRYCCRLLGRCGLSARFIRLFFNQAERFHITCAFTVIIASVIHTGAHLVNAVNCSLYYNHRWIEVNIAESPGQDPLQLVFFTLPGITGVLMMLILTMILVTSASWFRTRHFNTFYYSHHFLFGPFLVLLVFHPTSGMLKEQTNWRDHWPGNDDQDGPPPVFIPMKGYTWLYVTIPIIFYLFDWSWRKVSRRQPVSVSRVVVHEPDVIELVVDRWMSHSQPGQYVFLQCPVISGFQWHPFSLSSCCDMTHASWTVHMKTRGDWCKQLKSLLGKTQRDDVELYVDGPFSSPFSDVINSRTVICIAGGIGFTPFLCVIHNLIRNGWNARPERLHIVFCVQKAESLLWASAAIDQLIEDAWASPRPDKLEIRLHVTRPAPAACRGFSPVEIILSQKYPNLLRRLEYGRPKWKELFTSWKETYSRERVDVFSCGPRELNRQIEQMCRSISNFTLAYESFS
ncbi:NADPH oxidase 4-like [Daphnia pulex]|uniref:NADPH oxidase 4-like n=1 Tax=Daphnia pulex TaxID=6669 RepID=UPI001EDDE7E7|nr:NADPH oxidase 4-like [Daphnia pulex]